MAHWNHRVLTDDELYWIGEVYYDDDGNPEGYTYPVAPQGECLEDVSWELTQMQKALLKPVLKAWKND